LRGPIGRTGGAPAGIPGFGAFGRCLMAAGGPTNIFSGWFSHTASGSANFAQDGSKFSKNPESVDITIAESSSKVANLKLLIVTKLASMNFCSSLMLVKEEY
jgi:hypothetical protein